MAITNGRSHVNGFAPPPSSMLATHVIRGNGAQELNRSDFNQLLDEALGTDDEGNPNIGADSTFNHKLICTVAQAGLEPALGEFDDNPFRANSIGSKNAAQIYSCLDVIRLAIDRAPQALFITSQPPDNYTPDCELALYVWLIPKLLSLIAHEEEHGLWRSALAVVEACLSADGKCDLTADCPSIRLTLEACVKGMSPVVFVKYL